MTSSKSQSRRLSQMFTFLVTPEGEKSPVLHSVPEEPTHPASSVPHVVSTPDASVTPDDGVKSTSEPAPKLGARTVSEPKVSSTTRRFRRLSSAFPLSIITNNDSKPSQVESQNTLQKPALAPRPFTASGPPRSSSLPADPATANKLKKSTSRTTLRAQPSSPSVPTPPLPTDRTGGLAPPSMAEGAPPARPSSANLSVDGSPDGEGRSRKRMSWLPGSKSRQSSTEHKKSTGGPKAWMIAGTTKIDYDISTLEHAEKVPELWDDNADTYVYLFPRTAHDKGASFKIPSVVLADSQPLMNLARAANGLSATSPIRDTMSADGTVMSPRGGVTPPYTPKLGALDFNSEGSNDSLRSFDSSPMRENHLSIPINLSTDQYIGAGPAMLTQDDIDLLVSIRNLFAFLTGQPLVATHKHPTILKVFLSVAALLKQFEFSNMDGTTFGEAATSSFASYIDELKLADVRTSPEKTVEALVLGEHMRSLELYNEAFAHGAGKFKTIQDVTPQLYNMVSSTTRNRLDRSSMDLFIRQESVGNRLADFDFPSIFSGTAGSTSSAESKIVHFKAWRNHFTGFRKHVHTYYKDLYGSWPPKASSKRNSYTEGGLNRLVLNGMYADFSMLYDLLVDRTALTDRTLDQQETPDADLSNANISALRRILSEYDRSSPPVQPPVPFDVPLVPSRASIQANYTLLSPKDRHKSDNTKLKDYESLLCLAKAHNQDIEFAKTQNPFVKSFVEMEAKVAKGCTAPEIADQRFGHWLFLYAVLQSLPMLVVDAPGLMFTEGVEYFLCQPPKGAAPWAEDQGVKRAWYGVPGGQGMVSLPSDVVDYGVEAIYNRSHCWKKAEIWLSALNGPEPIPEGLPHSPLTPPPGFGSDLARPPSSAGSDASHYSQSNDAASIRSRMSTLTPPSSLMMRGNRSSVALGLEQLPLPSNFGSSESRPHAQSRTSSSGGGSLATPKTGGMKSFDDILGALPSQKDGKKKKGKK